MSDNLKAMVHTQIKHRNINDKRVLNAFLAVDRKNFVPKHAAHYAYEDSPLDIGNDQTISQPYIVALMTEALNIKPTDTILEIGTGSGYQTAILAELAETVHTVERIEPLMHQAKRILTKLNYTNIHFHLNQTSLGNKEHAPYDKIIVTAAARKLPKTLFAQLKEGGTMLIPIGSHWFQELLKIEKVNSAPKKTSLGGCRFVPLIE